VIVVLVAPIKVPETIAPLRRVSVSPQAGMAIAAVKRNATSNDLVVNSKILLMAILLSFDDLGRPKASYRATLMAGKNGRELLAVPYCTV
jgi:hypothetical protein